MTWYIKKKYPSSEIKTSDVGKTIQTPGFHSLFDNDFYKDDRYYRCSLHFPEDLAEQVGTGSLVIEIDIDIREINIMGKKRGKICILDKWSKDL